MARGTFFLQHAMEEEAAALVAVGSFGGHTSPVRVRVCVCVHTCVRMCACT